AGIAAVGVSHQTVWLLTSKERWTQSGFRELVGRIESSNNLRNMGFAMHNQESTTGTFPPGVLVDAQGRSLHGWQVLLLPELEEHRLSASIDLKKSWDDPVN